MCKKNLHNPRIGQTGVFSACRDINYFDKPGAHPINSIMPNKTRRNGQFDEVLEKALQRRDFALVRVILESEKLGVSNETAVDVTDELAFCKQWAHEDFEDRNSFKDVEIKVTPEEYEFLTADEIGPKQPMTFEEPSPKGAAILEAIGRQMMKNMPRRLERLMQEQDIQMLRTLLLICGFRILTRDPSTLHDRPADAPESPGNSLS